MVGVRCISRIARELGGSIAPGSVITRSHPPLAWVAPPYWRVPSANAASDWQLVRVRPENPPQELLPECDSGELQLRTTS